MVPQLINLKMKRERKRKRKVAAAEIPALFLDTKYRACKAGCS
jgi:hypothetical protein